MWLQLIIVPPQLYVGDCPSISGAKVGGSEVGQRFGGSEGVAEVREDIRDVC